jgi:uncharacterized membrane protein
MSVKELFQKNRTVISVGILSSVLLIVIAGCILSPTLFYDQWIWKYYWGPIVSDAAGHSVSYNGVSVQEGYTVISEITYGIILVIALYVIYKFLKKLKIVIDWRFCLALMPYILFGPVTRVLEDADYFNVPSVYWFISPLIYLQIAAYALFFVIMGYYFEKLSKKTDKMRFFVYPAVLLLGLNVFVTMIWIFGSKYSLHPIEPLIFYLVSCAALIPLTYTYFKQKTINVNTTLFSGGLLFLLPSLYLTARWIAGEQWGFSQGVRFDVFVLIFGLVASITAAVYLVSRRYKDSEKFVVYKNPLNLSMIAGHMIDGITSYVSIYDPLKMGLPLYMEKHPASNTLMEIWPPLFPIVKFILIIVVIYIFDVLYKEELKSYRAFANLLKIGILILGLSPGLRDLLRVTMGV